MKAVLVVLVLGLGGCALMDSSVQSYTTPDGRPGFMLSCGGALKSMATCYADARKMCQGGDYEIVNRSVTPRNETTTENRSIEIICKR